MLKAYFSDHMGAYDLLALALQEAYGLAQLPPMERGAFGKPFFSGVSDLHFNLSHSGPFVLCAVGDEAVGADIESVRPRAQGLPRYGLTEREYQKFEALGGGWEHFYALWTAREAWSKYTGMGVARSRGKDIPENLRLSAFAGEGWRATVCAVSPVESLLWR